MPRAYYASKISENISQSPEGYLICLNVPIARTGVQKYQASELGLAEIPADTMVEVHRSGDEVFSLAALSSFEGKPLTDGHPSGNVSPDNVCRLLKGVCSNVRRGTGEDADKVVADLVVYDPPLISEIKGGKRGISCGYDCDYEFDEEARIQQRNIRGNHVAVVPAGRAGNDVAIHDKAPDIPEPMPEAPATTPTLKRRKSPMSSKRNPKSSAGILGMLFPMFAKDADPDAVAEVMEVLGEALEAIPADSEPAAVPAPASVPASPKAGDEGGEETPPKWARDMMDRFDALEKKLGTPEDSDPLNKLENELAGGEASVTVEAEELGDSGADGEAEDEIHGSKGVGADPKGTTDSRAAALAELRSIKPVVAGIKDARQRKAITDSFERILRASLGAAKPGGGAYAAIVDARNSAAAGHKAQDAATDSRAQRAVNLGRELAAKHNPHYRDKK